MYDFKKDLQLTVNEKTVLNRIVSRLPVQYGNLILEPHIIDSVKRRSENEFDLELAGTQASSYAKDQTINFSGSDGCGKFTIPAGKKDSHQFRSWLPLMAIKELTNWTCARIANKSDYPDMVHRGDWSGISDSEIEVIWNIFNTEVL